MQHPRGTCSVCGADVAVAANGKPVGKHLRTIVFNPEAAPENRLSDTMNCRGSDREVVERKGQRVREISEQAARLRALVVR